MRCCAARGSRLQGATSHHSRPLPQETIANYYATQAPTFMNDAYIVGVRRRLSGDSVSQAALQDNMLIQRGKVWLAAERMGHSSFSSGCSGSPALC